MLTTSVSDFRKDIKRYLDQVIDDSEKLIINRGKDKGVVVMSLEDFNAIEATLHEISNPFNKARLDAAIDSVKNGRTSEREIIEP